MHPIAAELRVARNLFLHKREICRLISSGIAGGNVNYDQPSSGRITDPDISSYYLILRSLFRLFMHLYRVSIPLSQMAKEYRGLYYQLIMVILSAFDSHAASNSKRKLTSAVMNLLPSH